MVPHLHSKVKIVYDFTMSLTLWAKSKNRGGEAPGGPKRQTRETYCPMGQCEATVADLSF